MNTRGIIFTLDALFAVLTATLVLLATAQVFTGIPESSLSHLSLQRRAADALAGMDKNGVLLGAVNANSSGGIRNFMTVMPSNTCASTFVRLYPGGGMLMADQPSCSCPGSKAAAHRAFLRLTPAGGLETYTATIEACYK